jgi:serine/threonine protein kinase
VQKAEESIPFSRPEDTSPETFVWYGDLLDQSGRTERALRVFEELRERAPEQAHLTTRIEELRKKLSAAQRGADATVPTTAIGGFGSARYEVLEEIGAGGMGVVYRARDRRLGREVALKRLPEHVKQSPRAVELFLREARAAAALNHANIVTVHDVDQADGQFFITMELLRGTPLSQVLRRRGRLAPRDAARVGLQVAAGLGYAHARRIVHRDVKTANLFLTGDKVVKIMDFGLAKMVEEVRRASTLVGGTPYYMAPEQAAGDAVDHRADLYALGATLFELVTGRPPFTEGDITFHHRHTPPPDPRERVPELAPEWAELLAALLAKDPDRRPASADEVARRLARLAER